MRADREPKKTSVAEDAVFRTAATATLNLPERTYDARLQSE
jgi:hypothetical protein